MPSRPFEAHQKSERTRQIHSHSYNHIAQHGKANHHDLLLRVPSETLTHITSSLEPPSLLALAQTNRQLHAHVKDDNTWRRAYVYQYLGISPEADLRDDEGRKGLMLRRAETSWRKELIVRYTLRRRWEKSRNQPLTHIPHHSDITGMHLMPNTALLTSSLHYGIVARSYPLTGKILRGYLDATGTANGLGWGNPNIEFSPHVTAIALASEGQTAKVLWGYRNGEVAVTTANRAMDRNHASAAKHVRCKVDDCHEGAVRDVAWGVVPGMEGSSAFVTGAADGRVKLWDAKRVQSLWTSARGPDLVTDSCVKVAFDIVHGTVVCAKQSGAIVVWSGLGGALAGDVEIPQVTPRETLIPAFPALNPPSEASRTAADRELIDLRLIYSSGDRPSLLTVYKEDRYFYRVLVNLDSPGATERIAFGDGSPGAVQCVRPGFASQDGESSFILVGNQLGYISVFGWDAHPIGSARSVLPVKKFEAHEDGAVTAIALNQYVLVSGSARGTIKVWDSLSFAPLRSFGSPAVRPAVGGDWDGVGQIVLDSDVMVVSIGKKVMAWKAGPVGSHVKGKNKSLKSSKHNGLAKWQQQIEMHRDIAESRRDMEEETSHIRRVFGREREQHSVLSHLGLSEVEAVEYVLMLSRDEEERRRRIDRESFPASTSTAVADEGVFTADFDDIQALAPGPAAFIESPSSTTISSRTLSFPANSPPRDTIVINGRSLPRTYPPTTAHKLQMSPRVRPEPVEAGFSTSPIPGSLSSSFSTQSGVSIPSTSDPGQFPVISRTPSSAGMSIPSTGSFAMSRRSVSGTPESNRSAWATPLRSTRSTTSVPSSVFGPISASPPISQRASPSSRPGGGPSLITTGFAQQMHRQSTDQAVPHESDDDLQFAIELSLAEARSRGEDV